MPLKRRDFLILSSLSGFGLAFLVRKFRSQIAQSQDINPGETSKTSPSSNLGFKSTTVSSSQSPLLRFVSVADTGTGSASQYAVAASMARYHALKPFDLAILAGDNIYNNGEIEKIVDVFERPYQALLRRGVKFQAVLGNHDIRTDNGEPQVRYPGFNMQGRRYYTFRRNPVQFFALDTNENADWETQLKWLEKELTRSNAPWKVVVGHHQIYSSGAYGVNQPFIQTLTPLFKKYGVQLYINGHDHHYERTQPINGTTYLICGAGAGLRPVERSEWTAHSTSQLSFAALNVYADRIIISGIGTDNRIFDQGIIPLHSA
ncbi:metallophosphoesterase [Coleofasciculus sp. FACHB-129]|uniref:metallophosphoesterase family protein n=1 Tax=Cyanophyceae TaxID=3028117 RepID=UPI0016829F3C|nr:metallophosphoesterase [Coleofasciculus sp. FACHB-129]MBD1897989.1 metallophosphoesterase [Coleofasciculus sp. FACHB-129]